MRKFVIQKVFPNDGAGRWDRGAHRYCYWMLTTPSGEDMHWFTFEECIAHMDHLTGRKLL